MNTKWTLDAAYKHCLGKLKIWYAENYLIIKDKNCIFHKLQVDRWVESLDELLDGLPPFVLVCQLVIILQKTM